MPATRRSFLLGLLPLLSLLMLPSPLPILHSFLHAVHEFNLGVIVLWPRASVLKDNNDN